MGLTCDICRLTDTFIADEISKNTSIDDLLLGVQKLADDFGESSSLVSDLVSKHLPEIVYYLDQGMTPEEVCRALTFCE